jgi:hypothetical protein
MMKNDKALGLNADEVRALLDSIDAIPSAVCAIALYWV